MEAKICCEICVICVVHCATVVWKGTLLSSLHTWVPRANQIAFQIGRKKNIVESLYKFVMKCPLFISINGFGRRAGNQHQHGINMNAQHIYYILYMYIYMYIYIYIYYLYIYIILYMYMMSIIDICICQRTENRARKTHVFASVCSQVMKGWGGVGGGAC